MVNDMLNVGGYFARGIRIGIGIGIGIAEGNKGGQLSEGQIP